MSSAGVVSAIPSTIMPPPPVTSTYTITASNASGRTTASLTITLYNALQAVPNLAQSITPLAVSGSTFQFLDTGMVITDPIDTSVPPVEWLAGYGASTVVSPDGNTHRAFQVGFPFFDPMYSNEYVFIYDIHGGPPVFKQAVPIPNTYHGIVWDTGIDSQGNYNQAFYVAGGWATLLMEPTLFLTFIPMAIPGRPIMVTTSTSFSAIPSPAFGRRPRNWN
jgi:hypothetical protein